MSAYPKYKIFSWFFPSDLDFEILIFVKVLLRNITTNQRIDLKSHYGYEIHEVKVLGKDKYVVAHTSETLMIGDLTSSDLSEIPWRNQAGTEEKFYFENPSVGIVLCASCVMWCAVNNLGWSSGLHDIFRRRVDAGWIWR